MLRMKVAPIGVVANSPLVPAPDAAQLFALPSATAEASPTDFVLEGGSGLIVQSYGAIAFISAAALAQLAAARSAPTTFYVPAVLPVTRVAAIPRIDILV
ncbi:MAG: hypothetical protein NVS2B17_01160 [Candidatus Velthaea sp.]